MITKSEFQDIASDYQHRYGIDLVCVDAEGQIIYGISECSKLNNQVRCTECYRRAVYEALRWGGPSINCCQCGFAIWAAPLMNNNCVIGGLVATGVSLDEEYQCKFLSSDKIRKACEDLRLILEQKNLTNTALLMLNRLELGRETEKAQAIHQFKDTSYDSIREIYLREEPALLAAVKRGERKVARSILNQVLVGIYHFSGQRLDLLKSVVLELVVMLCRAAVEAGGEPSELLGNNYRSLAELAQVQDEEQLSAWLCNMLERQMDAIRDNRKYPNTVLLGKALAYMREHISDDLSRASVARNAGLSASHFSRLIKEKLGRTFTDLLRRYRVDHAKGLLLRTTKSLAEISAESGFSDQSYFTKVFQHYTGVTPGDYRRNQAP